MNLEIFCAQPVPTEFAKYLTSMYVRTSCVPHTAEYGNNSSHHVLWGRFFSSDVLLQKKRDVGPKLSQATPQIQRSRPITLGRYTRGTPTQQAARIYVMEQRRANYHRNIFASMHISHGFPDPDASDRGTHQRMTQQTMIRYHNDPMI